MAVPVHLAAEAVPTDTATQPVGIPTDTAAMRFALHVPRPLWAAPSGAFYDNPACKRCGEPQLLRHAVAALAGLLGLGRKKL